MPANFCPTPWNSLSILPDGRLRLCCHADELHLLEKADGQQLNLTDINNLQDLEKNSFLRSTRDKFIKNNSIPACDNCLKIECLGNKSPRNELIESFPEIDTSQFKLQFLDISFGNLCNMQCPMCSVNFSSRWAKKDAESSSIKSHNLEVWDRPFLKHQLSFLKSILIQGGEPFLSKDHLHFLDILIENSDTKNISIDYITNFSIPISNEIIERWKQFKNIKLNISIEGIQETYEYTRPPVKWEKLLKNLEQIRTLNNIEDLDITFHFKTTLQIYNIEGIVALLKFLSSYKDLSVSIPEFTMLNFPNHLRLDQIKQPLRKKRILQIQDYLDSIWQDHHGQSLRNLKSLSLTLESMATMDTVPLTGTFWKYTRYFDLKYGLAFRDISSNELYASLYKKT